MCVASAQASNREPETPSLDGLDGNSRIVYPETQSVTLPEQRLRQPLKEGYIYIICNIYIYIYTYNMLIYTVSTSLDGLPTARNGIPVRSDLVPGHAVKLGCRIRVQGRGLGPA